MKSTVKTVALWNIIKKYIFVLFLYLQSYILYTYWCKLSELWCSGLCMCFGLVYRLLALEEPDFISCPLSTLLSHKIKSDEHTTILEHSPRLLHLALWPVMAAHVSCNVVGLDELHQCAEDGIGCHNEEGQDPGGSNYFVGMGSGLPCPGL